MTPGGLREQGASPSFRTILGCPPSSRGAPTPCAGSPSASGAAAASLSMPRRCLSLLPFLCTLAPRTLLLGGWGARRPGACATPRCSRPLAGSHSGRPGGPRGRGGGEGAAAPRHPAGTCSARRISAPSPPVAVPCRPRGHAPCSGGRGRSFADTADPRCPRSRASCSGSGGRGPRSRASCSGSGGRGLIAAAAPCRRRSHAPCRDWGRLSTAPSFSTGSASAPTLGHSTRARAAAARAMVVVASRATCRRGRRGGGCQLCRTCGGGGALRRYRRCLPSSDCCPRCRSLGLHRHGLGSGRLGAACSRRVSPSVRLECWIGARGSGSRSCGGPRSSHDCSRSHHLGRGENFLQQGASCCVRLCRTCALLLYAAAIRRRLIGTRGSSHSVRGCHCRHHCLDVHNPTCLGRCSRSMCAGVARSKLPRHPPVDIPGEPRVSPKDVVLLELLLFRHRISYGAAVAWISRGN